MVKIMTIVGTRPEIIKLSRVLAELELYTQHILVHTGQNYDYELNEIFFKELGIKKPDHFLNAAMPTPAETIGAVIAKADALMATEKPDAILLYGDTNSCLAVIPAKRRKIPVFHMEAGNRCFDQRVPEELNRKIIDHLSDINMTLTEHARRYLISEGIRPETIIKTGSSMKEVLEHYAPQINASAIMKKMDLQPRGYFVLSAHREENIDSERNFNALIDTVNALVKQYKKPVIVSTHPRTMKKLEANPQKKLDPQVIVNRPFGFFDYITLQKNAFCVVSDSGTITEESSLLNFPAITIREAHERPEGMDEGTVIMSGLTFDTVRTAIDTVTGQTAHDPHVTRIIEDYNVDNVSKKVVRIILSYIGYINRTVWHKS